jgi:hypothetical protein
MDVAREPSEPGFTHPEPEHHSDGRDDQANNNQKLPGIVHCAKLITLSCHANLSLEARKSSTGKSLDVLSQGRMTARMGDKAHVEEKWL